jgi:drug/metabolite transporter (DMT)-like permease
MPPLLGALLAVIFWGVSFVATKAAVAELPPVSLVFARAGLGALLLLALLARRGELGAPPRATWRPLALMGFLGVAFHQTLQAYALELTSAVSTGWLIGLTPVWSALLARVTLGERLGAQKVAGLVLGFAGAVVVVARGQAGAAVLALPATRGDLLILLSTLNWAVYTVLAHATLRALGALRATAAAMAIGFGMLVVPWAVAGGWRDFAALSAGVWAAVLFLGVCCSGLGYLLWLGALEKVEASRVAALLFLEPLITLVAGVYLLGETVAASTVAGGLLLLAGVALVQAAPRTA